MASCESWTLESSELQAEIHPGCLLSSIPFQNEDIVKGEKGSKMTLIKALQQSQTSKKEKVLLTGKRAHFSC